MVKIQIDLETTSPEKEKLNSLLKTKYKKTHQTFGGFSIFTNNYLSA